MTESMSPKEESECQLQELVGAVFRVLAPQGQLSDSFVSEWQCIMRTEVSWPAEMGFSARWGLGFVCTSAESVVWRKELGLMGDPIHVV